MVYVLVMAIWGYIDTKKIKDKKLEESERVKNYRNGIIIGWIPVIVFAPICLFFNISFYDIGFRPISLNYNIWFSIITLVVSIGSFAYFILQITSYLASEKHREKMKLEMLKPENKLMYNVVLPHTIKEKKVLFWHLLDGWNM